MPSAARVEFAMSEVQEKELALAFDGQASKFEKAPVQSDPAALARLVNFTDLLPCSRVFDVGCGPGLVAEAFLTRGHWVVGVDLSEQMVIRARERCARFGQRATFEQGSVHDSKLQSFDAVVSRFVAHHAPDPLLLVRAQLAHVRTGGVVVVYDHTTDPRPEAAAWHQSIERARDRTHAANPTPGKLADLLAEAGLVQLALREEEFELDFDEWFDRGTPSKSKPEVRAMLLSGTARGFAPMPRADGGLTLRCFREMVRGIRPA